MQLLCILSDIILGVICMKEHRLIKNIQLHSGVGTKFYDRPIMTPAQCKSLQVQGRDLQVKERRVKVVQECLTAAGAL